MLRYLIKRLLWMVPVILVVSSITFFLMHSAPGGPWDRDPNARQVDAITQARLNEYYGLDKPMWRQYMAYMIGDTDKEGKFVCGLICGNLGPSYRQRGRTVQDILFKPPTDKSFWYSRFGYSLRLALISLTMAIVIGVPVGIISALKRNSIVDYVSLFIVTLGISVPNFVIAIFLIIVFASWLHLVSIVPTSWDEFDVWILPAVVLGFNTLARTARMTRLDAGSAAPGLCAHGAG